MSASKKEKIINNIYIYLEAILYGMLMIVTIFASMYGPIILKIIPLVFFLGIVGRLIYDRPVITSLLGFCISLCEIKIIGVYNLKDNLMFSLYNFVCILLGEILGMYIIKIYTSKSKTITKTKAKNISYVVLISFIAIFCNQYLNGDFIGYFKAVNRLNNYISENYPSEAKNVKIVDAKYLSFDLNYYLFTLSNLDMESSNEYKIGVCQDSSIIDGYYDSKLRKISNNLKDKFEFKYKNYDFDNIDVSISYINLNKQIKLIITKNVDLISNNEIESFATQINDILSKIKDFDEFDNIVKISAIIKSDKDAAEAQILKEYFYNTEEYLKLFNIEFFEV